ncbi:MAG: hypothetical protein J7M29_07415, partial [Verrucomicrobia bacterium]|nr:hypothetical protein [Verrucomicrobiota bacterium]
MKRAQRIEMKVWLAVAAAAVLAVGCRQEPPPAPARTEAAPQPPPSRSENKGGRKMKLTSAAFEQGRPIPVRHTCQGEDVSPP